MSLPQSSRGDYEEARNGAPGSVRSLPSSEDSYVAFPYKQLCVLAFCRVAEPIAFNSIVAYSFVMVQEIKGKEDASFFAGLLISAFALAEACTAMYWGHLSDKYGRKPIILVALSGTALSSLLFGFAKTYWVALLARVVGGLLNGNVAVMQTMVAEMVQKPEHEPIAYAMQPFMWSLGSIAGSALGGFAAKPAQYHPRWFSADGLFGMYPYLLPNLIAVGVMLLALLQGYLFLEETNASVQNKIKPGFQDPPVNINDTTPLRAEWCDEVVNPASRRQSGSFVAAKVPIPVEPSFDIRRPSSASLITTRLLNQDSSPDANDEALVLEISVSAQDPVSAVKAFNKEVIIWIVALILMCFHQMAFSSLLPIYLQDKAHQPPHQLDLSGGLGVTLPEVGTFLAFNSAVALIVQGVVFPIFVERLGVWRSVVVLTMTCPLVYLGVPFVSLLSNPGLGIYIVIILQSFSTLIIYPCLLIMLKNATPSPQVLGKVNGLAMSACSGARTIAPPAVGIIYSKTGSAGAWWTSGSVALLAVFELIFMTRPRSNERDILGKASTSFDEP